MRDAMGSPQSLLVLGGGSDIGFAIASALVADRVRRVVLAGRDVATIESRAESLRHAGATVDVIAYDALMPGAHDAALDAAAERGDIDVIAVAFGALGDPFELDADLAATAELCALDFDATITALQACAGRLERQGHGSLVALSSVAGARVRPENAVYGATKAGIDSFTLALADRLHGSGVHVMAVRPGFVHSKMTEGRPAAPFATTPERVAVDVVAGLRRHSRVIWSPPVLRAVFSALRVLPAPVWRRLIT